MLGSGAERFGAPLDRPSVLSDVASRPAFRRASPWGLNEPEQDLWSIDPKGRKGDYYSIGIMTPNFKDLVPKGSGNYRCPFTWQRLRNKRKLARHSSTVLLVTHEGWTGIGNSCPSPVNLKA